MRFDEVLSSYRALEARRVELVRDRPTDQRALREVESAHRTLLGRAAAQLPKDDDTLLRALAGQDDATELALQLLERRQQFPRAYLQAAIEAAVRMRAPRFLRTAGAAHGAPAVLDALTRSVDVGLISYERWKLLSYYVAGREDDDPEDMSFALWLLRLALRQTPDAPAGVRAAFEPRPSSIVALIDWSGSGSQRAAFGRAVQRGLGFGVRRAEWLLDRTVAHPGAVALELAEGAERLLGELAPTGVALRHLPVGETLSAARETLRTLRRELAACSSGAARREVRPDLDPWRP